ISPSSKGNPSTSSGPASSLPPTSLPPPGGPQSYYRQHTLPGGVLLPPPPGMMVDGHYPPGIGLPTSATRLHQANWPHPPWGDGSQPPPPQMIPMGYPHPYYNAPPYYRPDMMHPPDMVPPQQIPNSVGSPHTGESSSSRTGSPAMGSMAVDPSLGPPGVDSPATVESRDGDADAATAVIDPSLVSPASSADGNSVSMEITQAAVEAAFKSAERDSSSSHAPAVSDTALSSPGHGQLVSSHSSSEISREGEGNVDDDATGVQEHPSSGHPIPNTHLSYSSPNPTPLERPPEMEQMLTEDGEPMLNPAELLTQVSPSNAIPTVLELMLQILRQESLASPPPS
ncbi:hypothetical protein HYDPIDRAFT_109588, partial [Hydnomerulius pinastri MD-312]